MPRYGQKDMQEGLLSRPASPDSSLMGSPGVSRPVSPARAKKPGSFGGSAPPATEQARAPKKLEAPRGGGGEREMDDMASPASSRSSRSSPGRTVSFVGRAGGVATAHEEALLPYASMPEKLKLATELRHVVGECTATFAALPKVSGNDRAVSAAECRKAIEKLCSPRHTRRAFPLWDRVVRNSDSKARAAKCMGAGLAILMCWSVWFAVFVLVLPTTNANDQECWSMCDEKSGPCSFCGVGKCCRKGYKGGENGCGADEGMVDHHGCVGDADSKDWDDIWPVSVIAGVMCAMPLYLLGSEKVHEFPDRAETTAERCVSRCLGLAAGEENPDALPLYCDDPTRIAFGEMASFAPDAVADGETPSGSVVTLPMFLSRCMTTFVPRTTAGDAKLRLHFGKRGGKRGPPGPDQLSKLKFSLEFSDCVYMREVFHALRISSGHERTTVDVPTFALAATRCNFHYTAKDIEAIAARIGIPDDMAFGDFIILHTCLEMEVISDEKDKANATTALVDYSKRARYMQTVADLCASEFEQYASEEDSPEFGLDEVCAIVFGTTLRPWLQPHKALVPDTGRSEIGLVPKDWDDSTLDLRNAEWQVENEAWIRETIGKSVQETGTPVCFEHLVFVATNLLLETWFSYQNNHEFAAKLYFEAVTGSIDRPANPHELLDLMYGYGTLVEDERKRALTMLGAATSGVDLDEAMQELDHTVRTSRFDSAAVALDKVQRIKSQQEATDSVLVDFCSWLQFAVDNELPYKENIQQIRQERLQENPARNEFSCKSYWAEFAWWLSGLSAARIAWEPHLPFREQLKAAAPACLAGIIFTTGGPWYWALLSWHRELSSSGMFGGTLPWYMAIAPLLLTLPACHVFALDKTDNNQQDVASRGRLSCITVPRIDQEVASPQDMSVQEVYDTLVAPAGRMANEEPFVLIAFLEMSSLLGFAGVCFGLPEIWPDYIKANPMGSAMITGWCGMVQCIFVIFAVMFGRTFQKNAKAKLAAVDRTVTCSPPIIDLTHPENVVAWCRLRDRTARSISLGKAGATTVANVAAISVAWAFMAAFASLVLLFEHAALTPFRTVCGWFGSVGGVTALVQLLSLASADRSVARQARMLEHQLERINQQAVMAEKNQTKTASGVGLDVTLRSAASVIRTELDTYRQTPERRYFYLFGFPAWSVVKTMGTLLATQGAAYIWSYVVRTFISSNCMSCSHDCCLLQIERPGCGRLRHPRWIWIWLLSRGLLQIFYGARSLRITKRQLKAKGVSLNDGVK
eukprot:COSAG04_NODE_228_length_19279_cov_89.380970_5_plen_1262_part_00